MTITGDITPSHSIHFFVTSSAIPHLKFLRSLADLLSFTSSNFMKTLRGFRRNQSSINLFFVSSDLTSVRRRLVSDLALRKTIPRSSLAAPLDQPPHPCRHSGRCHPTSPT